MPQPQSKGEKNMKKCMTLLLALLLLTSLAACQDTQPETTQTTGTTPVTTTGTQPQEGTFAFTASGVELTPGAAFDPSVLPEAAFTYEVPSCAIEGTDLVYNYETFELTAYNDGTGPVIYSIFLVDANITTPEGLAIGDDAARVTELYGSEHQTADNQLTYTKGNTQLILLLQDDTVISIEYRMV